MSQDGEDDRTRAELRDELRSARSRIRALESELTETNEGMVALTLELESARERYQTIFEETTDGILLIDPERDSIYEANPQVCSMLNYDREDLVSLTPADIFPDVSDRTDSFADAVVQGWADGFACRTSDGRSVDVDVSASVVTLDGRSLLLASLRDVTERKRRAQRLQVLTRIFRHNLRNDGNLVQGHADVLFDAVSGDAQQRHVRQIRRTIEDLLQLSRKVRRVQDVLDRTGVERISIADLLAAQRTRFEQEHPDGVLTVDASGDEEFVDRRVSVVLQEALDNAAEHVAGPVSITVSAVADASTAQVRIDVTDDGQGIPDYEVKAMRTGTETPLTHGSGIGLWTMYWVIDSVGGELDVRGDESGTTVSMTVPALAERGRSELWE